jgi:hypothetical protein
MVKRGPVFAAAACLLATLSLTGCGGGNGNSPNSARAQARAREIATTRLIRTTLAVSGLGRKLFTRSVGVRGSRRVSFILAALHGGRATQTGLDPDTGLYYTLTTNVDGSGSQLLFTDAAHTIPGGSFTWGAPQWNNGQPDSYPAVIHVVFDITAGAYDGTSGTLDITLKDAAAVNCIIKIALRNRLRESCNSTYDTSGDIFTGGGTVVLTDGSTCEEQVSVEPDGTIMCGMDWPDGSSGTLQVNPDGSTDVTIKDSYGDTVTGDVQPDGTDYIDYGGGDYETVDDNTSSEYDYGDDSGDNSNDNWRHIRRSAPKRAVPVKGRT